MPNQNPVNDANRAVNVNTVAGTDTGLNRDAPRKHLGVPDPYASREATLAEDRTCQGGLRSGPTEGRCLAIWETIPIIQEYATSSVSRPGAR